MHSFYNKLKEKVKWYHIIILYVIQIAMFRVMMHITFPIIENGLGDYHILDMVKQGYDITYVQTILSLMSESAKNIYLYIQMPLDFIYPVIMALVFLYIYVKTWSKFWYIFCILPIFLIAFDWIENICIILLFTDYSNNILIINISSFCTQAKAFIGDYILYYLAILSLITLFAKFIYGKFKKIHN